MEAAEKVLHELHVKLDFMQKILFNYPVLSLACSHHFVERV